LELEARGKIHFIETPHSERIVVRDPNMLLLKKLPSKVSFEFVEPFNPLAELLKHMGREV